MEIKNINILICYTVSGPLEKIENSFPGKDHLESSPCPLCHSEHNRILFSVPPFNIVECNHCFLRFLNPRLKEDVIRNLYTICNYYEAEGASGYDSYLSQEHTLRLTFRRFLEKLKARHLTGGSLLEIGCGYGFFLDEARKHYSYLAATEFSPNAAQYAREMTGADIFTGGIDSIPPDLNDFDIIVTLNVIEHVYSPVNFLQSLMGKLNISGRIVIATPDAGSLWFKLLGRNWPSLKIPEHIAFYSSETLAGLFRKAGLKNICNIGYLHAFPLGLILQKMKLKIPERIAGIPIWLPKTMIAMTGQKG